MGTCLEKFQFRLLSTKLSTSFTYLVVQVFESECDEFALGNARDGEEEPRFVVVSLCVRLGITTCPQVIVVFLESSLGSCQIARAKLTAEDYFGVWNVPARSLWECLKRGLVIDRLVRGQFDGLRVEWLQIGRHHSIIVHHALCLSRLVLLLGCGLDLLAFSFFGRGELGDAESIRCIVLPLIVLLLLMLFHLDVEAS